MNTRRPLANLTRTVLFATAALSPVLVPAAGAAQAPRSVVEAENQLRNLRGAPAPTSPGSLPAMGGAIDRILGGLGRDRQPPSVLATRVDGEWRNEHVRMTFHTRSDGVAAHAYPKRPDGTERHYTALLKLNETKDALVGDWEEIGANSSYSQGGSWRVTMSAGRVLVAGPLHGHVGTVHALLPVNPPVAPNPAYADWLGEWSVHGGKLVLSMEQGRMVGVLRMPAYSGLNEPRRELVFTGQKDTFETEGDTLVGLWQGVGEWSGLNGQARMTLLPGKRAFGGSLAGDPHYSAWKGARIPRTPPVAGPQGPTPPAHTPAQPPSGPATPSPSPSPAHNDGFQPLEKWDVRVDRVENPREDRLTHVYLTLRNSGTGTLVQTQGVSVRHEDGDGVVTESGQGLRAKPGYPELFGSPPPVVLPGREIKTKFVFDRNGGTSRITVVEGKAAADFDF